MAKNKGNKKANKAAKANKAKAEAPTTEEEKVVKPTAKEAKAAKELAIKSDFESKFSKPSKSKAAIGKAIVSKELAGIKSSTEIGGLLLDAKFYFPNGKGDFDCKAWLVWAEAEFDYKKSQAHNLVKIHTVFADDETLNGLKPTILIALTRDVDMLEAAKEALIGGADIDNKWLTAYKELHAPALEDKSSDSDDSEGGEGGESSSAKQREKDDKFITSLEDKIEELTAKVKELEKAAKAAKKGGSDNNQAAIDEAVEKGIAEAMAVEHKAVAARMSKQAPHVQLGLKEDAASRQINQAVIALDKIYGTKSDTPSEAIMNLVKEAQAAMKK